MPTKSTREGSAKDDAPSLSDYRLMKLDAKDNLEGDWRDECLFVLVTLGELGLRAGELAHIKRSWVDLDNQILRVQGHSPCDSGQDGGICDYCKNRAKSAAEHNDITYEEALKDRWQPKMESSARTLPYGWSRDIRDIYDRFFRKWDRFQYSRVTVNRRVNRIADASEFVEKEDIYPHALRSHAAIKHASNGVGAYRLAEFMGWSSPKGAIPYIKMASKDVRSAFDRAYGDGEDGVLDR